MAEIERPHRKLEGKSGLFAVLTTVVVLIGGLVEIVPLLSVPGAETAEALEVEPHSPLEVAGRDIYLREGCYNCHSQMVRPMRSDTLRYRPDPTRQGEWSRSYEYVYEHPFQMGSRRIGPDLHREGGRYNDAWHYEHLRDPRTSSPGSVMPAYPWLLEDQIDVEDVQASLTALQTLGVPYSDEDIAQAPARMQAQGEHIAERLAQSNLAASWNDEVVALIAYLQSLGRNAPFHEDLSGVALGEALWTDLRCQSCHGPDGSREAENPNSASGPLRSLRTLAGRMGLASPEEVASAVRLLSERSDLEALRADPPFADYEAFLTALAEQRDILGQGRVVHRLDPAGPVPRAMPPYGSFLNLRHVDALIAALLSWQGSGTP
jgi:cbb3-type cytochrome c oxidase subunit II